MTLSYPLQLIPEYRDYLWGGQRLRPGQLTAEAWAIYEGDRIAAGPLAGRTLADVAAEYGPALLGQRATERTGTRFPLLVKILDVAQWLSLQVHPDDALAVALEGPGHFGKTEAWHVVEAEPGAQFIAGLRSETTAEALAAAIRRGTILDWVQYRDVRPGDTALMPARTVHALGPGLLIYEVQQTSDLTYRVFDWNRPATPGRPLHIEKSLAVANPAAAATLQHAPVLGDGERARLATCAYFTLELIASQGKPVTLHTAGRTFHALTVIEGAAEFVPLTAGPQEETGTPTSAPLVLKRFDSVIIPADCGPYQLNPLGGYRVMLSSIGEN